MIVQNVIGDGESMEEKLLKIGELAKLVGVSAKALRLYEKMDIIKPAKVDEENGYRLYSPDQSKRVESLLEWQDMGFSLKEIKIIFSGRYSKEDIIRMVREDDVEFIRMQFTDIFGKLNPL